jgi:hypothetical protein
MLNFMKYFAGIFNPTLQVYFVPFRDTYFYDVSLF